MCGRFCGDAQAPKGASPNLSNRAKSAEEGYNPLNDLLCQSDVCRRRRDAMRIPRIGREILGGAFFIFLSVQAFGANFGLSFDGANDYVTFGPANRLDSATFTIEIWFKRTGTGVSTSTGSGGVDAIPLLAKGRAEA